VASSTTIKAAPFILPAGGLRMAEALAEVRESIDRNVAAKKG
jgi:hypothetical protein